MLVAFGSHIKNMANMMKMFKLHVYSPLLWFVREEGVSSMHKWEEKKNNESDLFHLSRERKILLFKTKKREYRNNICCCPM